MSLFNFLKGPKKYSRQDISKRLSHKNWVTLVICGWQLVNRKNILRNFKTIKEISDKHGLDFRGVLAFVRSFCKNLSDNGTRLEKRKVWVFIYPGDEEFPDPSLGNPKMCAIKTHTMCINPNKTTCTWCVLQ